MKKIFSFLLLCTSITFFAQNEVDKTKSTVSKNDIEGHIYFLASDELRGRETGTPEIDIAASYLANSFRRYGVKPANKNSYYQNVELQKVSAAKNTSLKLNSISTQKLITLKAQNIDFNGEAIFLNFGQEEDYKGKNVSGKLVITKAGSPENESPMGAFQAAKDKRKLAIEKGAIGIVEIANINNQVWGQFLHFFNEDKLGLTEKEQGNFVHVWMKNTNGSIAQKLISEKSINASLSIKGIHKTKVNWQ